MYFRVRFPLWAFPAGSSVSPFCECVRLTADVVVRTWRCSQKLSGLEEGGVRRCSLGHGPPDKLDALALL